MSSVLSTWSQPACARACEMRQTNSMWFIASSCCYFPSMAATQHLVYLCFCDRRKYLRSGLTETDDEITLFCKCICHLAALVVWSPGAATQWCLAVNVWVETQSLTHSRVSLLALECRDKKSECACAGVWVGEEFLGTAGLLSGRPEATSDLWPQDS